MSGAAPKKYQQRCSAKVSRTHDLTRASALLGEIDPLDSISETEPGAQNGC
jgi:hypothetical protein